MKVIRGTMVSDGTSDQMLFPIIHWLFHENGMPAVELTRPNLGALRYPPVRLIDRVRTAILQNPCDLVLVHRDAESQTYSERAEEIASDLRELGAETPRVRIIPVRMSEAWLLIDEDAIRRVAQRPNGRAPLSMPQLSQLEGLPNPKAKLLDLLVTASETSGRRLDQFKKEARSRIHQLAEFIPDYSPLRKLPAFRSFEAEFTHVVGELS
ncbi:MAG TPA: hypothetical protein VGJ89_02500 [Geothrix sp.]